MEIKILKRKRNYSNNQISFVLNLELEMNEYEFLIDKNIEDEIKKILKKEISKRRNEAGKAYESYVRGNENGDSIFS